MEDSPSATNFVFCASSPETFGSAFMLFLAQLGVPWATAPILSFHIRHPLVLQPYQALLRNLIPPAAVSLQFDQFHDLGVFAGVLSQWQHVQGLRITVGSSDHAPYTRSLFHHLYLAPFEDGLSFPTMSGVKAVIVKVIGAEVVLVSVCCVIASERAR